MGLGFLWHWVARIHMSSALDRRSLGLPPPLMAAELQLSRVVSAWAVAQREASGALGPPRPILLWLPGEGASGLMSSAPHWVPSEQLPLVPLRHGGHQGPWRLHFLYPTGQAPWPCPLSWWRPWSFHDPTQPWDLLLAPPLAELSTFQGPLSLAPSIPYQSSPGRDSTGFMYLADPLSC